MQQEIIINNAYTPLVVLVEKQNERKVLLVCDGAYDYLKVKDELDVFRNAQPTHGSFR